MQYEEGEQDMIAMRHRFEVEYSRTNRTTLTSTLIDFGQQDKGGNSSMARTVALPLAAAVWLLLEGKFEGVSGVLRPVTPEIYNPILDEMATLGIQFFEEELKPQLWLRSETKKGEQRTCVCFVFIFSLSLSFDLSRNKFDFLFFSWSFFHQFSF
jgi:hypothetical protein